MKVLIICLSVHHGNTGKVAAVLAGELNATIIRPSEVDVSKLGAYDLIGFGSGIYHHSHHRSLIDLAEKLPRMEKPAFIFSTRAYGKPLPARREDHSNLRERLEARDYRIVGEFSCRGWSTFSVMRLFGGVNRGSPGEKELAEARHFARSVRVSGGEARTEIIDSDTDRLSRVFFLKGRKTVIVDTGRPGRHGAILRSLDAVGIKRDGVSLILLTHGHEDHTGNAPQLKEALGAPIAMGKADATYISKGLNAPLCPRTLMGRLTTAIVGPKTKAFQPDILIEGETDLSPYGVDALAFPTPGHTAGSISIATADGCLTGDLLTGKYFVTGRPTISKLIEVPEAMESSIQAVINRKPTVVYPSHGVPWRTDQVRRLLTKTSNKHG